jgi:hypothetical protein
MSFDVRRGELALMSLSVSLCVFLSVSYRFVDVSCAERVDHLRPPEPRGVPLSIECSLQGPGTPKLAA